MNPIWAFEFLRRKTRRSLFYINLIAATSSQTAAAHNIGRAKWCLVMTPTHMECLYTTSLTCNEAIERAVSIKNPDASKDDKQIVKTDLVCIENENFDSNSKSGPGMFSDRPF